MKSLALVLCLIAAGCGESITRPTELPPIPGTEHKQSTKPEPTAEPTPDAPAVPAPVPYGAGTTTAAGLCKDIQQGVSCLVLAYTRERALVLVTNSSAAGQVVSMESYSLGIPDEFSTQTVIDAIEATFPAGASGTLEVRLPPCGYQADVHLGYKVNFPPHPLHSLLGFEKVGTACAPPVPDPPVAPPVTPPIPPVTPDPPIRPIPPKPPVEPPLTECNAGIVDRSWTRAADTATATFRVLPGYEVTLWFAGYQRLNYGFDSQRLLGYVPPMVYGEGWHSVTLPARSPLGQHDGWCGEFIPEDVTPENFARFNVLHDYFSYYLLEPDPQGFAARSWR